MIPLFVIAGLDPAIRPAVPHLLRVRMDARVKPGHDEKFFVACGEKRVAR
jgi:hypothetical protein